MGRRLPVLILSSWLLVVYSACIRKPQLAPRWTAETAMRFTWAPALADNAEVALLLQALDRSLMALAPVADETYLQFGRETVPVSRLRASLSDFREHLAIMGQTPEFLEYVRQNYIFYRSATDSVLFTGYYEPLLHGARQKSDVYRYPLYGRPDDLLVVDLAQYSFFQKYPDLPRQIRGRLTPDKHVVPYWTRADIDSAGKLAERSLEIVWINDPVDVFFLHIQGSGRILFDDGGEMRVGYAEQNGHPFSSIGKTLLKRDELKMAGMSMAAIRVWLNSHPGEMADVLNSNTSYIFFRETPDGPIGSTGVTITAGRSIATDNRLFPGHALCFVATEEPLLGANGELAGWQPLQRFVVNQDTGGAIRGPDRVDFFFGSGDAAGLVAGTMKRQGMLYFLLKKSVTMIQSKER